MEVIPIRDVHSWKSNRTTTLCYWLHVFAMDLCASVWHRSFCGIFIFKRKCLSKISLIKKQTVSHFVHCLAAPQAQSSFSWSNNGIIDIKERQNTHTYAYIFTMKHGLGCRLTRLEPLLSSLLLFSHWTFWIPNWCGHHNWYGQTNLSHWESHLNCLLTDGNCWCFDTTFQPNAVGFHKMNANIQ